MQNPAISPDDTVVYTPTGEEYLNLRYKLRETYGQAIKDKISTLTFAPVRSYKTEAVELAIYQYGNAFLFDLREAPSPRSESWKDKTFSLIKKKSEGKHNVFLDSIDIIPLDLLKELTGRLEKEEFVVHIVGHLFFYDTTRELGSLLAGKIEIFPQCLSSKDIQIIKRCLSIQEKSADLIIDRFINYAQGWPGLIYKIDKQAKRKKILEVIKTYSSKVHNQIEADRFAFLIYTHIYKDIFDELGKFITPKAKQFAEKLGENKIVLSPKEIDNLPQSIKKRDLNTWEAFRAGLLWFNSEENTLLIPKILREMKIYG